MSLVQIELGTAKGVRFVGTLYADGQELTLPQPPGGTITWSETKKMATVRYGQNKTRYELPITKTPAVVEETHKLFGATISHGKIVLTYVEE